MLTEKLRKRDEENVRKGMEKGIEKGMEKGMVLARQQMAKRLLGLGIDVDTVALGTELTRQEIESLRS